MEPVARAVLALVLLAAVSAGEGANDLVIGHRAKGDQLLHEDNVRKYNVIPLRQIAIEKTYAGDDEITQIRALDMDKNDRGGTAVVTAGGVGDKLVTVKFTNKISLVPTAIDFRVKIYGIRGSRAEE